MRAASGFHARTGPGRVCSWEHAAAIVEDARPEQPDRAGWLRRRRRRRGRWGQGRRCRRGCGSWCGRGREGSRRGRRGVPFFPPPLLPTGACEEATPSAAGAAGVATRPRRALVTDATGRAFTTGPSGVLLVSPPACAPSAARAIPPPPGPRPTSLATSPWTNRTSNTNDASAHSEASFLLERARMRRDRRLTAEPTFDLAKLDLRGSLSLQKFVRRSQNESINRTSRCGISERRSVERHAEHPAGRVYNGDWAVTPTLRGWKDPTARVAAAEAEPEQFTPKCRNCEAPAGLVATTQ
jgi:hypothetical protein